MRNRLRAAVLEYNRIRDNKRMAWVERPVLDMPDGPVLVMCSEDIEYYNRKLDGFKMRWESLCEQEQDLKEKMFGKLDYTPYGDLSVKELLEVVERFMNKADEDKKVG